MDSLQAIFSNVWTIAVAILFLGMSIFVHELGHFLAARKRGMKVERFSIGFGPAIWSWKGKDDVEYRISWLPLGGYVALPQLADMGAIEGETKTDLSKLPPVSYATKVIVASAGAVFNVLFAFLLATFVWIVGQQAAVDDQTNVISIVRQTVETRDGKTIPGPAFAAGIKLGDTVLAVDGSNIRTISDIMEHVALGAGRGENGQPKVTLTVKQGDSVRDIDVYPAYISSDGIRDIGISIPVRIVVVEVMADSAAAAAGLKAGDILTRIDDALITTTNAVRDHIAVTQDKPVTIAYERDGKTSSVVLTPRLTTNPETKAPAYLVGITQYSAPTLTTIHVLPWTQITNAISRSWNSLKSLVNPRSDIGLSKASGPIEIIKAISVTARYDFIAAISLLILINIGLAIFNMLPIPVLDGGHILFATIAKIRGRPLPPRFILTAQSICMMLLLSLMIYVSYFNVLRLFPSKANNAPAQQAPAAPATPEPSPAK